MYFHELLVYHGQHFTTIPFILLACFILPKIMECILKSLFALKCNKGKKFLLYYFFTKLLYKEYSGICKLKTRLKITKYIHIRSIFRTLSNICFFENIVNNFQLYTILAQRKLHRRCLTGFQICLCICINQLSNNIFPCCNTDTIAKRKT